MKINVTKVCGPTILVFREGGMSNVQKIEQPPNPCVGYFTSSGINT